MPTQDKNIARVPLHKLCDMFVNIIERLLKERALLGVPCGDLSDVQWEGLLFIQRHEGCAIRELAEGLGVSHPAAVKLVERLLGKHLIQRRKSAEDQRVVELQLSPAGQRCVDYVRDYRARGLEYIMARLDKESAEALRKGLQAFVQAALDGEEAVQAICLRCGTEHVNECLIYQMSQRRA